MFSLTKPSVPVLTAFLAQQRELPFSYPEVGQSREGTLSVSAMDTLSVSALEQPGYDVDHNRVQIGDGPAAFEAACDALRHWRQFPAPWTAIYPPDTPLVEGSVVAMLARVFGLWWLNSCRIVYAIDEQPVLRPENTAAVRRFGFAYGTLPGHVERGEERFLVECDEQERVWYDLRAFSRPRFWAARLGYPLARQQQRRFVRDSQAAMRAAVAAACALRATPQNS